MPAGCFGWVSRASAVTQQPDLSLSMENWFLFTPCVENWLPAPQYLHAPAWRVPVHGLVVVQQLICWEPCFEWDTRWCGRLWPERKEVSGGKGHQASCVIWWLYIQVFSKSRWKKINFFFQNQFFLKILVVVTTKKPWQEVVSIAFCLSVFFCRVNLCIPCRFSVSFASPSYYSLCMRGHSHFRARKVRMGIFCIYAL